MSTSFVKRYEHECAADEETRHNEAAEPRAASHEPDLQHWVEIIAAQKEQIAALNAQISQLAHAIITIHKGDERRHRELLRAIDAIRHSLPEPVPTLGNMGRGSYPPKQIPTASYGIRRHENWPV